MTLVMGVILLNLLFGALSLAWVGRSGPFDRLLGTTPSEQPPSARWSWLLPLLIGLAGFSVFFLGSVGLLVLLGIWAMMVLRWPWHALHLGGRGVRVRMVVMLLAGVVGGVLFDWLRHVQDVDWPRSVLIALFVLSVTLLVVQRSLLLGLHALLWACMLDGRPGHAWCALLLTLLTGYFGLFYTLWRAQQHCIESMQKDAHVGTD